MRVSSSDYQNMKRNPSKVEDLRDAIRSIEEEKDGFQIISKPGVTRMPSE
jgi:hypothetical protein